MGIARTLYRAIPAKKTIFSLIKGFSTPPYNIYKNLRFKGVVDVKIGSNSFKINTDYDKYVETKLFWKGVNAHYEKMSYDLWINLSKKANVILDVGANTGIYSLMTKTVNPSAQVYGFEPMPDVYRQFLANEKLNNFGIHCLELAASNEDGTADIYTNPTEQLYTSTLNSENTVENSIKTTIKTITLKTWIEQNNIKNIDLMKVDVESFEPQVMEGMGEYLKQMRPTMLMEILSNEVGEAVEKHLEGCDYLFFNLDEETKPVQVPHLNAEGYLNHLICSKETAQELGIL
jgi:FkbM family methyltransferase